MSKYPQILEKLIDEFSKMPGVGPKTAERLALYVLKTTKAEAASLAQIILKVKETIQYCQVCNNLSQETVCHICKDERRDKSIICVVEEPKDIIAIEKSAQYQGVYHVLLGSLSPLDGIGPDDIKIKELLVRLKPDLVKEVIIATSSDTEGEATALYLTKILKPLGLKITRIAYGIPMGSQLEYADPTTLSRAMEHRREI
jgi:recombination protein RecR